MMMMTTMLHIVTTQMLVHLLICSTCSGPLCPHAATVGRQTGSCFSRAGPSHSNLWLWLKLSARGGGWIQLKYWPVRRRHRTHRGRYSLMEELSLLHLTGCSEEIATQLLERFPYILKPPLSSSSHCHHCWDVHKASNWVINSKQL